MDSVFGRNRFIVSNAFGLTSTLERITAENVSRIAHLRLNHLGCDLIDSAALSRPLREVVPPGEMYVDIDILREAPWSQVTGRPVNVAEGIAKPDPNILTFVRGRGLLVDEGGSTRFELLPDNKVRLLVIPVLMRRVLQAIIRDGGGPPLVLNPRMLEFIVQNWLWVSHILTCPESEPSQCKVCVRALGWLSA